MLDGASKRPSQQHHVSRGARDSLLRRELFEFYSVIIIHWHGYHSCIGTVVSRPRSNLRSRAGTHDDIICNHPEQQDRSCNPQLGRLAIERYYPQGGIYRKDAILGDSCASTTWDSAKLKQRGKSYMGTIGVAAGPQLLSTAGLLISVCKGLHMQKFKVGVTARHLSLHTCYTCTNTEHASHHACTIQIKFEQGKTKRIG